MTEAENVLRDRTLDDAIWSEWVGRVVYVNTGLHHYVGELVAVTAQEIWIKDAAWVPQDGRWHEALKSGEFDELEPCPYRGAIPLGRSCLAVATIIPDAKSPPSEVR